ncbi:MAG: MotA/TolQ/ExbB proton channel family protein, partial [Limisphaerales bacterium]
AGSAKADLEKALAELSALEKQIADEKIPLSREMNKLESEVIAKRREHSDAKRLQDRKAVDLTRLKAEEKAFKDQNDYLRKTLLEEYIRRFETRTHASEKEQYTTLVKTARAANENPSAKSEEVFTSQLEVVQAALDRLDNILGGYVYEGSAVADGVPEKGRFVMVGPLVMFTGNSGQSGLAEQLRGTTEASLIDLEDEAFAVGISNTISSGAGELPFDSTMGNALKIKQVEETWWEHINKGGVVIWPLLGLGLAAALVALIKWFQLSALKQVHPSDLQAVLDKVNENDTASALALAKRIKGPAGELLETAIQNTDQSKEMLEEILYERMLHTKPKLDRFLPFISLTAATAPLLG